MYVLLRNRGGTVAYHHQVIILPGIKIGKGAVVGAGSVVTKDVPAFHVVAGNPARVLRKIETSMNPEQDLHQARNLD